MSDTTLTTLPTPAPTDLPPCPYPTDKPAPTKPALTDFPAPPISAPTDAPDQPTPTPPPAPIPTDFPTPASPLHADNPHQNTIEALKRAQALALAQGCVLRHRYVSSNMVCTSGLLARGEGLDPCAIDTPSHYAVERTLIDEGHTYGYSGHVSICAWNNDVLQNADISDTVALFQRTIDRLERVA